MDGLLFQLMFELADRILELQLAALEAGYLFLVGLGVLEFLGNLPVQYPVLALQFDKMRFEGHMLTSFVKIDTSKVP
jgi:hypothetical protein